MSFPQDLGGWTETVLHRFTGGKDGKIPSGPVISDTEGNLCGTTRRGITHSYGVVFELKQIADRWHERVLHKFRGGSDGQFPIAGVIKDKAGNLCGPHATVFKLSHSERGWAERVTCRVATSGAGVTMDHTGDMFLAYWTVLRLSKNDADNWTADIIHTFTGYVKDGYWASSRPVLDRAGNQSF